MTDERDPRKESALDLGPVDERLCAWVDGELGGKELERFEAELRVNKRLREQAEAYRQLVVSVQGALRQPVGTVDVAERVIAVLQRPEAVLPRHRSLLLPWLLSGAVAAGLLTAVWLMQRPDAPCPPEGRESATAPSGSKLDDASLIAEENEKKRMAERVLDPAAAEPMQEHKVGGVLRDQVTDEATRARLERKADTGELQALVKEQADKLEPDVRAAKPGEKSGAAGDAPSKLAKEADRSDRKQEESKNKSSDEFYLGKERREVQPNQDRAKTPAPAETRPFGDGHPADNPAPVLTASTPEPTAAPRPQVPAGAAGRPLADKDKDKDGEQSNLSARNLDARQKQLGGLGVEANVPVVQVVVLTRRGTPEELRTNLKQRQTDAEAESARRDPRGREPSLVGEQLAQQFPSLTPGLQSPGAQAQGYQQLSSATSYGLHLSFLSVPDVQPSFFRGVLDQGRESTGNRAPTETEQSLHYRQEALQRLLPAGTRANALYVEGEAVRVQDFLQQVGSWAQQNAVVLSTDEVPAAEVDNLKLNQLRGMSLQAGGQVPLAGGGGGGKATGGPTGPATPGPAGPATGGPAGPGASASAGPRSAPVPAPKDPPQSAPTKAVLLLFREQSETPGTRR